MKRLLGKSDQMRRRPNPQTLRRLTYFAAIADAGSIREAARRLGLSVASVSESLTALEEELAVTLATRNTRQLVLTAEGRRVEQIAERVLDASEALFADVTDPGEINGHVSFTVPVEIAQSWLPTILEQFQSRCPHVTVCVSASDLVVDLAQSSFDLAIRARFHPPGTGAPGAYSLPLTCVAARPIPIEPTDYGWFAPVTLLSHQTRDDLDVCDARTGEMRTLRFKDVMKVDNKHVALAMVSRGMGAALVTRAALVDNSALCECPPYLEFGQTLLTVEMRDKRPSLAATALQAVLAEETSKNVG